MSEANNKVLPKGQVLISYCDKGAIYHTAQAVYHIAQRYIIDRTIIVFYNHYRVISGIAFGIYGYCDGSFYIGEKSDYLYAILSVLINKMIC